MRTLTAPSPLQDSELAERLHRIVLFMIGSEGMVVNGHDVGFAYDRV